MLVLTRKHEEGVLIGDHTIVKVLVKGNRIRLGIESTDNIARLELLEEVPTIKRKSQLDHLVDEIRARMPRGELVHDDKPHDA